MEVSLDRIRLLIGTLTLENLALQEQLEKPPIPVEPLGVDATKEVLEKLTAALGQQRTVEPCG